MSSDISKKILSLQPGSSTGAKF